MGKFHSKHGDCYINVNTHVGSMLSSDSDCSHRPLISDDSDVVSKEYTEIRVPLQVVLPPVISDALTGEVKSHDMEKKALHTDTDTTDNNISVNRNSTLHVEEFECGLSVQSTHLEKQEWSFTLYDFDGRGRVTKEDLGQLLKSLYDAVGSTISLPLEGTKSLKLRLTVSPDQTKLQNKTESPAAPDLNRKECNRDKEQKHVPKKDINTKLNNGLVTASPQKPNNQEEGTSSQPRVELRNNLSKAHRGRHKQGSPSKRLSAVEHHPVVDSLQHNMQHSRQKQQKVRRHHSEVTGVQTGVHHTPKRSNQSNDPVTTSLENPDRRNYYLDLAGIENPATTSLLNTSLPEPIPEVSGASPQHPRGAKSRSRPRTEKQGKKTEVNGEQKEKRTKSADLANDSEQLLSEMNQVLAGVGEVSLAQGGAVSGAQRVGDRLKASKCFGGQTSQNVTPTKAGRHGKHQVPGGTAATPSPLMQTAHGGVEVVENSPCHRRHKPRDKNHVRAMQQVADWIEKEHSRQCDGAPIVIERHEHHHIHEHHHHHHYHHYHGT